MLPGMPRIDVSGGGHFELPGTRDGYDSAVVRRGPDGTVMWKVLPPEGDGDAWVDVCVEDDVVAANSWSGWLVEFDLVAGTEPERHFTKLSALTCRRWR